jgi:hypothetical protein
VKTSGAGCRVYRQLLPALASLCLVGTLRSATPPAPNESSNAAYQVLPLQRSRQNHLLVRAQINGKPALLGVDTGASLSAIDLHRRKHFHITGLPGSSKLPPELRINGGLNRVAIAHHLRLGRLILLDEPMIAIDLAGPALAAREFPEETLDGLLGTDILFPTGAIIDCAQQVLLMKVDPDAPGPVPAFDRRGWRAVPMRVSPEWNLFVEGRLNGKAVQLLIDTGAFTTLINEPFVRQLGLQPRDTPYSSGLINLDKRDVQLVTIRHFAIGKYKVKRKEVGVVDLTDFIAGGLLDLSPPMVGLLGSEFLRRNHAIIDFGARTLYLKL